MDAVKFSDFKGYELGRAAAEHEMALRTLAMVDSFVKVKFKVVEKMPEKRVIGFNRANWEAK